MKQKNNIRKKFLFTSERKSFPVVEFKSSPDESLNIPSFIFETTWPRVLYFYYPNQSKFEFFHSSYVQIARRVRHDSDILVLFYAISCAAHDTMCSNTELIKNTGVPILKAYESGSVLGTEIVIEKSFDDNTRGGINLVVQQLSTALSLGDLNSNALDQNGGLARPDHIEGGTGMVEKNAIQETYDDALKAFILTLKHNIYGDLEKVWENKSLEDTKADVLKDFLDLCYWSLPPTWELHTILFNLRSDFDTVIAGPSSFKSIVSGHESLGEISWSKNCGRETVEFSSYSCGLWKLLHIISVGVNEASKNVMGDVVRAKPAYVAWVIRDFISEFIPDERNRKEELLNMLPWCTGCRDNVIHSFDSCKYDVLCVDKLRNLDQKHTTVVAHWLWEMHLLDESRPPEKRLELSNEEFVYGAVKQVFWPSDKSVRIAVLKPFSRDMPTFKHKRIGDEVIFYFVLMILILMFAYSSRLFERIIFKRAKKN